MGDGCAADETTVSEVAVTRKNVTSAEFRPGDSQRSV